jgi:DNA-3-methyladenine glycosylase I
MTYCQAISQMDPERRALHGAYHDNQYGFPLYDDNELFGRLILEINQAGLSWETILKKEAGFWKAYDGFDISKIAAYDQDQRQRLLEDPGIVRNRLKVDAAISNAKVILELQVSHGSFANWLASHHPLSKDGWVKLFKSHFRFTGGEIVGEFLMSIGYLPGAHGEDCPVYDHIRTLNPPWAQETK